MKETVQYFGKYIYSKSVYSLSCQESDEKINTTLVHLVHLYLYGNDDATMRKQLA